MTKTMSVNFAQVRVPHAYLAGVYYNNRNWLHVLKAMRVWCVVSMLLTPLCTAAAVVFEQAHADGRVWCAVAYRDTIANRCVGTIVIAGKEVSMHQDELQGERTTAPFCF